ncbi:unnamed protein product [Ranitomeya imitator]|uniref:Uncharacterized protein n=1 Tax=Ranitomeya imitator TaxID=111125 RepID=A0ABN9LGV0_9NEOB|nr:unnamed protein product [Ranitomeya imitator]
MAWARTPAASAYATARSGHALPTSAPSGCRPGSASPEPHEPPYQHRFLSPAPRAQISMRKAQAPVVTAHFPARHNLAQPTTTQDFRCSCVVVLAFARSRGRSPVVSVIILYPECQCHYPVPRVLVSLSCTPSVSVIILYPQCQCHYPVPRVSVSLSCTPSVSVIILYPQCQCHYPVPRVSVSLSCTPSVRVIIQYPQSRGDKLYKLETLRNHNY